MGYTKHDYQSNDILYAADLAEMDNQIYKNEQDILKLEENKQPAGNYASSEEVSELRSDLEKHTHTADDVGALSAESLPDAINTALAQAKESGEFDGLNGKDGTSVTVSSVSESDADGGSNVVTFSDGKTVTVRNGKTGAKGDKGERGEKGETGSSGAKGDDGYTPQKNVDYSDGKDGKDGVSATHSWNGTVLTVTSASGSSSADLKGADGKNGVDGKDGTRIHKYNANITQNPDGYLEIYNITYRLGDMVLCTHDNCLYEVSEEVSDHTFYLTLLCNLKGEDGADGSDANVTTENITAALGYTPANEEDVTRVRSDLEKKNSYVVQDTEPEDTSVLWVDPNDNSDDGFQEAVNVALAQAKESGEFDGLNGKDGTSVTVSSVSESNVDGGDNVVTFSDGKTVTIKNGSKGSTGDKGVDGVGIKSVTQTTTSTADDGDNVITVTLTNGTSTTFKVQNGSKGSDGKTPVKGIDYFTSADEAEMVNAVIAALPVYSGEVI